MKSFTINCLALSVVIALSSCTKNDLTTRPENNNVSTSQTSVSDDLSLAIDSIVITGNVNRGDQTALIQSRNNPDLRDNNYVNFPAFNGLIWTWNGTPGIDRSLMKFNLQGLPKTLIDNPPHIKKVVLRLYEYQRNDGLDVYAINQTISNEAEIHRIAGSWKSNTVTWNNQPPLAHGSVNKLEDAVTIPAIKTPLAINKKDNIAVNITAMVRRIVTDKLNNGFMLKIADELRPYCGRSFGSFACPETDKRPRLIIYYER